jgi:hypothetical protein
MIYPQLNSENKVQESDKTRLDATSSFANLGDVITLVEIDPLGDGTFYDVTESLSLDWSYPIAAVYAPVLRIDGISVPGSITIVTALEDNLFSNDNDLRNHEDDILRWVREGRNSYLDKHRLAQEIILAELDKSAIWKNNGERYTSVDIVDIQEFKEWSKYLCLRLFYDSMSYATDDIFDVKSKRYRGEEVSSKKRACLRLDTNGDGNTIKIEIQTASLSYGG